ncbi:MAG: transcriptional regulator [Thermoplasmata archaeon]|nr:MAG: transcriptional regulator [Thermoplasmata archaeon]RLF72426.1 MAG: transcriptional regulator [Thermoplasmata archaeon]HDD59808.1 CBS domain-containing protein [Euryarchaeota archaeon]
MNVSSIMTKNVIAATLPTTRADVLRLMVKYKKTGLPVVDEEGRVLGIVTRKDFFSHPQEEQVAIVMRWDPPKVSPSTAVERAAKIMVENNARRLPVVKNGKLVGILTPTDFLKVVVKRKIDEPVERYMEQQCFTIFKLTPANVAAKMINLSRVFAMPVLDEHGEICGMITDRDLFNIEYLRESISLTKLGISEDEDEWSWEGLRNVMNLYFQEAKVHLPKEPVEKFMNKDVVTVFRKKPLWEAAEIMLKRDFDQLPVVDVHDELLSILYDIRVVRSLVPP